MEFWLPPKKHAMRRKSYGGRTTVKSRMGSSRLRSRTRSVRGKRVSRRGASRRPVNASKVHVLTSRQFSWGYIQVTGAPGVASPTNVQLATPDNLTGTPATITNWNAASGSGIWSAATAHSFSLFDLPSAFLAEVGSFAFFRLKSVSLSVKVSHSYTAGPIVITAAGTTTQILDPGRLRMFVNRQHDVGSNLPPTSADDILKYAKHQIIEVKDNRLIKVQPSITMPVLDQAGSLIAGTPSWGKWMDTSNLVAATTAPIYEGLQIWWEWENPPVNYLGIGTTFSYPVEIFATYVIEVKEMNQ